MKNIYLQDTFRSVVAIFLCLISNLYVLINIPSAEAVSSPSIYLSTTTGSAVVGSTIAVQVRENSGTELINALQFDLVYPSSILNYQSFDATGSTFDIAASSSVSSGTLTVARGKIGGASGDQLLATVYFTVTGTGTATLSFDSGSALLRASDNTNLPITTSGGSFSFLSTTQVTSCSSIEQQSKWVYRLYDPVTYKHFYTPYMCEYYALPKIANYQPEGAAWNTTPANAVGAVPVYRLYNPSTRIHFWSSSQADITSANQYSGYTLEGIGFYSVSPDAPSIYPIYRMYNPKTYLHLWTQSQTEVTAAAKYSGYYLEGTAFYTQ